jgi:signal transduction histidine kinase
VDAHWRLDDRGALVLVSSPLPALQGLAGSRLLRIEGSDGLALPADADLLQYTPRWSVSDARRARQTHAQIELAELLRAGAPRLHFEGAAPVRLPPQVRGLGGLGAMFLLLVAIALTLPVVAATVLLRHPLQRNLPYAALALCLSGNLAALAIEALPGLGLPLAYARHGPWLRTALDLCSAAAMVHLSTLQPLHLPGGRWIAGATWAVVAAILLPAAGGRLPLAWWWTLAGMLGCGLLTQGLMTWSYRLEPNPVALLLRRLAAAASVTLLLLGTAIAVTAWRPTPDTADAADAAAAWYLFMASLALLLPVFSRARPLMRELAMLAGTCSVATSLELLLSTLLAPGRVAALSLAVFCALAVYAGTRRWLLQPIGRHRLPGAEHMFERLYRVLREVEARPRDGAELLTQLLRDLFEPLEVRPLQQSSARSRVLAEGSALLVPLPAMDAAPEPRNEGALLLRFAERGRRMFSRDDARLADRLVDQLRRAVAYDKAVERGRSEERARIAQDLHDDIGARLLTLMYKAQSPEMEDYLRHTLKDLKTLTRGLASSDQHLSHATAEWKTDIAQRLAAAQIELSWRFDFDRDIVLGVVQWSALTRVLRELVSNVIQHSCATHLEVVGSLEGGRLRLSLADDGIGREPQGWSHGLGMGGVRKRVKLLGGDVQWRENGRAGIVCTVLVPHLGARQ